MKPRLDRVDWPIVALGEFFARESLVVGQENAVARLSIDRAETTTERSSVDHVRLPVAIFGDPLEPIRTILGCRGWRGAPLPQHVDRAVSRDRVHPRTRWRSLRRKVSCVLPNTQKYVLQDLFRWRPDLHDTQDCREKFRRGQIVEAAERGAIPIGHRKKQPVEFSRFRREHETSRATSRRSCAGQVARNSLKHNSKAGNVTLEGMATFLGRRHQQGSSPGRRSAFEPWGPGSARRPG